MYREDICLQLQALLLLLKFANHRNKRPFVSTANGTLVGTLMTMGDVNDVFPIASFVRVLVKVMVTGSPCHASRSAYATFKITIILFLCPPKCCISIVSSFSWDLHWSKKKIKTIFVQNFGGKQGVLWYYFFEIGLLVFTQAIDNLSLVFKLLRNMSL